MQLITSALSAFFLVRVFMLPYRTWNVKPFNCVGCMGAWCMFCACVVNAELDLLSIMAAGTIAVFVDEVYNRLIGNGVVIKFKKKEIP